MSHVLFYIVFVCFALTPIIIHMAPRRNSTLCQARCPHVIKLGKRKIHWLIYNQAVLWFNFSGFYKVICLADIFIFNGEASLDDGLLLFMKYL